MPLVLSDKKKTCSQNHAARSKTPNNSTTAQAVTNPSGGKATAKVLFTKKRRGGFLTFPRKKVRLTHQGESQTPKDEKKLKTTKT